MRLFLCCVWQPGFAGEDWLHTWCDNRPEEVWWSPTRICSFRGSANHWYRGKTNFLYSCAQILFIRVMTLLKLCSNWCYFDSLPLRADGILFNWNAAVYFFFQLKWRYFHLPLCQIFVGKIPRDLFEDELVPLFEKAGPIWDLRLMMDPLSGLNRGYAFVTFCTKEAAQQAVKLVRLRSLHNKNKCTPLCFFLHSAQPTQQRTVTVDIFLIVSKVLSPPLPQFSLQCNNNEIRPGKHIGVCISVANNRLFVGSIPKSKTKEQIIEEFSKVTGELALVLGRSQSKDLCFETSQELVSKWWPHHYAGVTGFTMTVYR